MQDGTGQDRLNYSEIQRGLYRLTLDERKSLFQEYISGNVPPQHRKDIARDALRSIQFQRDREQVAADCGIVVNLQARLESEQARAAAKTRQWIVRGFLLVFFLFAVVFLFAVLFQLKGVTTLGTILTLLVSALIGFYAGRGQSEFLP